MRLPTSQNFSASRLNCWVPRKFAPTKFTSLARKGFPGAHFNLVVCALRFLYQQTLHRDWAVEKIPYAKKTKRRPVILSLDEVCAFLEAFSNLKYRCWS